MSRLLNLTERVFEAALTEEKQRLERRFPWSESLNGAKLSGNNGSLAAAPTTDLATRREERDRRRLAEVEAALQRLHEGDYGRCESCDALIDVPTLLQTPWTRYCADCLAALAA